MTDKEYQEHTIIGKCKNCGSTIYDWDIMSDMATYECWNCEIRHSYNEIAND